MPRRDRREEDLIASAITALEDEVRCWREGPARPDHRGRREDEIVMLMRYPRMDLTIGPADYVPEADLTVRHLEMTRKEVPFFLRWQGMEAAIKKIREMEGRDRPPSPREAERADDMVAIENRELYTGRDAPGFAVMR